MCSFGRPFGLPSLALTLLVGCERASEQPWRKALDEGNVVRLGGGVGKLSPSPTAANGPAFSPPVIVQPTAGGNAPPAKKSPIDDLPIPPPPKAAEKKANPQSTDDEPRLGPPR